MLISSINSALRVLLLVFSLVALPLNALAFDSIAENSLDISNEKIVEIICLHVPSNLKKVWLNAEHETWKPWLLKQDGFLGRQLLWDKEKEEAMLLITWESRSKWKTIPLSEISIVQEEFENYARKAIGKKEGNPFPVQYEGELIPQ